MAPLAATVPTWQDSCICTVTLHCQFP